MTVALPKSRAPGLPGFAGLAMPAAAEGCVVECPCGAARPKAGSVFCNQGGKIGVVSPGPHVDMWLTIEVPAARCPTVGCIINGFRGAGGGGG